MSVNNEHAVAQWVREILALKSASEITVHERNACEVVIVIATGEQRETRIIPMSLAQLSWPLLAGALLQLGPSCADTPG